jgi:hypothetical protein
VPPEPSPSVSIAVSAVSIDLTAISINLVVSYNEEGVVLPGAEGSTGSYVVHLSLLWCDLYVIVSFVSS